MKATCYKSPSHRTFRRMVDLAGNGWEIVDDRLHVVAIGNPQIMRVVRRYTGVFCVHCGEDARVSVNPDAWKPSSS